MGCSPETLRSVPLFSLFDEDEICVLANEVEIKDFAPRQRIYKIGDNSGRAYVMVSGKVRVTIFDEDHQEVVVDEPIARRIFRLRFDARTNAASDQRDRARSNALPRSRSPRHPGAAGAQAPRRHGHAHRARPPVSRGAAARAIARQPQSQRGDRSRRDLWRTHRRRRRWFRRFVDIYHLFRRRYRGYAAAIRSSAKAPGIRIHSSC